MVLPSISPLSRITSLCDDETSPPPHFKPIRGEITDVRMGPQRTLSQISSGMSLAKIAGLKYEKAFTDYMLTNQSRVAIQPHIHFKDAGVSRTCIPDLFMWGSFGVVVFEIKSQHMPESWWQLSRLYIPVLEKLLPGQGPVRGVEVCRRYDPQLRWPGSYVIYNDLEDAIEGVAAMGVLKWKPT